MKAYVKPELFYERYELSQHIADCALELQNSNDVFTCYATPDMNKTSGFEADWQLFTEQGICMVITQAYCYTPGEGGLNLWKS